MSLRSSSMALLSALLAMGDAPVRRNTFLPPLATEEKSYTGRPAKRRRLRVVREDDMFTTRAGGKMQRHGVKKARNR